MKVAIDIGNTNIVVGFRHQGVWVHVLRMNTADTHHENEWSAFLHQCQVDITTIKEVVLSSVVPVMTEKMHQIVRRLLHTQALEVNAQVIRKLNLGKSINPDEIGTDLVANAVGAHDRFGKAVIVVDFGTALTFTAVAHDGHILGVAIAAGVKTAMKALEIHAARLPEIPLDIPPHAIGTNTKAAMQSGIMQGYVGLVRHLIAQIKKEMNDTPIVIATGGLSFIFKPLHDLFEEIDMHLTLDGLLCVARQYKASSPCE